jgi:hypothetical protein
VRAKLTVTTGAAPMLLVGWENPNLLDIRAMLCSIPPQGKRRRLASRLRFLLLFFLHLEGGRVFRRDL